MQYTKLTINQQLTTVRQLIGTYEQEHYNLSLQDLLNGGPTEMGLDNGQVFTSADKQKKLEGGIDLLNQECARLEGLIPKPIEKLNDTGQIEAEPPVAEQA